MKVSKRDFLKLLGGGSATVGAVTANSAGPVVKMTHRPEILPTITEALPIVKPGPPDWNTPYSMFQVIEDHLWDRVAFSPGAHVPKQIGLFTEAAFQKCPYSGRIKDWTDTNMVTARHLPAPEAFWVRRIEVNVSDLPEFTAHYLWRFFITQKRWAWGRLNRKSDCSFTFEYSKGLWIPTGCYFYGQIEYASQGDYSTDYSMELPSAIPLTVRMDLWGLHVWGIS